MTRNVWRILKMLLVKLCKNKKCCPSVWKENNTFILGGDEEGFTKWTPEQFKDLIERAKAGEFDNHIKG